MRGFPVFTPLACTVLTLFSLSAPPPVRAWEDTDASRPAVQRSVEKIAPALVRIRGVWVDHQNGRTVRSEVIGSGFLVDPRGFVVTNHHVAGHAENLSCVFFDNEEIKAVRYGDDPPTDLTVLRLEAAPGRSFPTVEWGDPASVLVGDKVLAMGSPMSLSQSVTEGIVSNLKMIMPGLRNRSGSRGKGGEDVGLLVRWIGHDAAIYPGNSGGPLVDLTGKVIGVNEIRFGLGGAIPADLARRVVGQLIAGRRVSRSWLGLELQPLLKSCGIKSGALISTVVEGSPAARAGIRSGDVLTALGTKPVNVAYEEELPPAHQELASLPIGEPITLRFQRKGGRETTVKLEPIPWDPVDLRQWELDAWGMTVKNPSGEDVRELRLDSREGALVTSVSPGGSAAAASLPIRNGDVVVSLDGKRIEDCGELSRLTREWVAGKSAQRPALAGISRDSEKILTVVRLGIPPERRPATEAKKAWLGVSVQAVTRDLASMLGHDGLRGVRVTEVFPGSSAEKAGLRVGDLIVSIAGEPVRVSRLGDEEMFLRMVRSRGIDTSPVFGVIRGTEALKVAIRLRRSPPSAGELRRHRERGFGFAVRDIGLLDRRRKGLREGEPAVLVTEVTNGGWADLAGLEAGDLILDATASPVGSTEELEHALGLAASRRNEFVVFKVRRAESTLYVELEPAWPKSDDDDPGGLK